MIRQITADEIDQCMELTEVAFAVNFTEQELRERRAQIKPEQVWGYFLDDRLAAQIAVLPLQIYLNGQLFPMGGIAQVASYPEMRRQGMVGRLLARGLEAMRDSGQTISFLNPFSYSFYRKYGWEYFSEVKSYSLKLADHGKFQAAEGHIKRGNANDWEPVHRVYEAFAPRYNGMLHRDEAWWRRHVFRRKLGNMAIYYNGPGEPRGYMLYTIKDRFMGIHEMIYLDEDSRRGLWHFAGNHDSIVEGVSCSAPADDGFMFSLRNPDVKQELTAFFMVRIVDVLAFMNRFPFASGEDSVELTIRLTDEHAPWNQGTFRLSVDAEGKAIAAKLEGSESLDGEGVTCDIQAFSSMMIGYRRPSFLHEIGRLSGSGTEIEKWERILPKRTTYLTDFF
ncbi:GNAT family N-acetyltransferase [Paenibacillus contaminans]|nr:GNAT family N-acetyltransferase [Paenibacillus contaminans]